MKNIIRFIVALLFGIISPPNLHAQDAYKPFIPLTVNYSSGISPEGDILIGYSIDQVYLSLAGESDFLHLDIQFAEKDSIKNSNYIKQILWANKDTVLLFIYQLDLLTGRTKSFVLFSGDKCKTFRLITIFNSAIQYAQLLDNNELYISIAFMNFYVTPDFGETWYQEITEVPSRSQNTFIFNYSPGKKTATYFSNSGLYLNKKAHKKYIPYKTIENWQTISLPKALELTDNLFDGQVQQLIVANDTIVIAANNKVYYTAIDKIQWYELANARNFVYDKSGVFYVQTENGSIYKYNAIGGEKNVTPFNAKNSIYNLQTANGKCYTLCRDSIFMVGEKSITAKPLLIRNEAIPIFGDTVFYKTEKFHWSDNKILKYDSIKKCFYRLAETPFHIITINVINEILFCYDYQYNTYAIDPRTGKIKPKELDPLNLKNIKLKDTMYLEVLSENLNHNLVSDVLLFQKDTSQFIRNSEINSIYKYPQYFKDSLIEFEVTEFLKLITDSCNKPQTLKSLGIDDIDILNFIKVIEENDETILTLIKSFTSEHYFEFEINDFNKQKIIESARNLKNLSSDSLINILNNFGYNLSGRQVLTFHFSDSVNNQIAIRSTASENDFEFPVIVVSFQQFPYFVRSLFIYQHFLNTFTTTQLVVDNNYKSALIMNLILLQYLPK